ncbi:MAG TPA: aminotransferase class I/II-fold pyridoxal phosphate-dependent enzyme, partial [Bacilli bacterium]
YYSILQNWTESRYGYKIEPEWVVTTTGVVSALKFSVLALTEERSKIMIFTPVYNPFYEVVSTSGRELVESKLVFEEGKYKINFSEVEKRMQEGLAMIIFCNPHNPVGRVWSEEEILTLVGLAKKYKVLLLSDEIHCDLMIGGSKFTSLGRYFCDYEGIFKVFAPSKTFNLAGLKLANMIIPNKNLREKVASLIQDLHISPDLLAVSACKAAYRDAAYWVDLQNEHLTRQYRFLKAFLEKRIPEVKLAPLEGTYLAWADFRFLGLSSKELSERLLHYGIQFNRGDVYGADYDGFLRINLACSEKQLFRGLEALENFVNDVYRNEKANL